MAFELNFDFILDALTIKSLRILRLLIIENINVASDNLYRQSTVNFFGQNVAIGGKNLEKLSFKREYLQYLQIYR